MKTISLKDALASLAAAGLEAFDIRRRETIGDLCLALMKLKGEASATTIAGQILKEYADSDRDEKREFFRFLLDRFSPDPDIVEATIREYHEQPGLDALGALADAVQAPRQALFRLLNMAPAGTQALVSMRADLLSLIREEPDLKHVDSDMVHLLSSWFNPGFLELRQIDWTTPAFILEKLIDYESVHEIQGWDDLRRRLAPDRRCFGFFHPVMPDEPLIFVEVALTDELTATIADVLERGAPQDREDFRPTAAIFYSINNCQKGLRGVPLGNLLIKQVVERLSDEIHELRTFATLSPIPGFCQWLNMARREGLPDFVSDAAGKLLYLLDSDHWPGDAAASGALNALLPKLCAHYLLNEKRGDGLEPLDPVARFHLGNGARLERINWMGDPSPKGLEQSAGLLVNYLYDRKSVASNHEAYVNRGAIACAPQVSQLLKS